MHQTTGGSSEGTITPIARSCLSRRAVDVAPMFVSTDDFYAGQDVSRLPRSLVKLLPREAQLEYGIASRLPAIGRVCSNRRWVHGYHGDGPTLSECAAVVNGLERNINFRRDCERLRLWVVGTFAYCAGHTSMVQLEPFAPCKQPRQSFAQYLRPR